MTAFSVNSPTSQFAALRTLRGVDSLLTTAQNRIATGLSVAGPVDDGSSFAIAQGVRADLRVNLVLRQQLASARGIASVALAGATGVSDALSELRRITVAASNPANTDTQLQIYASQFDEGLEQIGSIIRTSSYNGINLLASDGSDVSIVATETAGTIVLPHIDFEASVYDLLSVTTLRDAIEGSEDETPTVPSGGGLSDAETAVTDAIEGRLPQHGAGEIEEFIDRLQDQFGGTSGEQTDFLNNLAGYLDAGGSTGARVRALTNFALNRIDSNDSFINELLIAISLTLLIAIVENAAGSSSGGGGGGGGGGSGGGGSGSGSGTSVPSATFSQVLSTIELSTQTVALGIGQIGAASRAIDAQDRFLDQQLEAAQSGLGALVDADLERESARNTALLVQRDLALETLSIAGQRRKDVLVSLFDGVTAPSFAPSLSRSAILKPTGAAPSVLVRPAVNEDA